MFGGLLSVSEHDVDQIVDRVLSDERVEKIARRVTEMLLAHLLEGLRQKDEKRV